MNSKSKRKQGTSVLYILLSLGICFLISCNAADSLLGLNESFLPENRILAVPIITQDKDAISIGDSAVFSASGS